MGAGSFGVGPSSAVSNTQKASSKVCSQALLWKNLICAVGHESCGLLRRCHVAEAKHSPTKSRTGK